MKKTIIILGLILMPLLGFCQSPGDRMIASEGFKYFANVKQITDTLQRKVEAQQLQQIKDQKANEDKILAIKKESEPICIQITTDEESKFICILKAIFLGGKFPWETEEEYKVRLQVSKLPATQPSK